MAKMSASSSLQISKIVQSSAVLSARCLTDLSACTCWTGWAGALLVHVLLVQEQKLTVLFKFRWLGQLAKSA